MSGKKNNTRVLLTKSLVQEALVKMLKTQNINKISILTLCQIAGINRTTFYNHYGSQYDVLNEIADSYIENTSFVVIENLASGKEIKECLIIVLQYIKDNLDFVKLILAQNNFDLVFHIKASLPQFDHAIIKHLPESLNFDDKKAIASYVQYGSLQLLKEWIYTDCVKTPEQLAEQILFITGKTMLSFAR